MPLNGGTITLDSKPNLSSISWGAVTQYTDDSTITYPIYVIEKYNTATQTWDRLTQSATTLDISGDPQYQAYRIMVVDHAGDESVPATFIKGGAC